MSELNPNDRTFLDPLIRFCLEQKLVVVLLTLLLIGWGVAVAPFDWEIEWLPRDPVPVDAIPNLGENQQIVFTEWPGRSPQDVDDQITYPLTVNLMGLPGVREVRSQSMLGFSMIFVIFDDDTEFYWSRDRIIEKLNSLPADTLPEGVSPALGPDATALGQVFWYTLEGRDPDGEPAGGWDLHELRRVQDWHVRFGLLSAEGMSEIASIGGHVPEYLIEADPDAMRAYDVTLMDVLDAVRASNLDVGAGVTEINRVEYLVRGLGFIEEIEDIERVAVTARGDDVPVRVRDVANVSRAPAPRRGALTVSGAEAVGGVAVVREGYNPLQAIHNVKERVEEISPGLPARAVVDWDRIDRRELERFADAHGFEAFASAALNHEDWLEHLRDTPREHWPEWITISQLEVVPFYDRTDLIYRTLGTLNDALVQQILVTVIVVLVLVVHLRSALVISSMLPLAVLLSFILMKLVGVDANVVALAGIAIAIGTIVDMGVIVTENVLKHLRDAQPEDSRLHRVFRGTQEVGSAVLTAVSTTIISFLPVFTMTGAEGKMFVPLAYTKTFVLFGAIFAALVIVPAAVHVMIASEVRRKALRRALLVALGFVAVALFTVALAIGWSWIWPLALLLLGLVLYHLLEDDLPAIAGKLGPQWHGRARTLAHGLRRGATWLASAIAAVIVGYILAQVWEPLGPERGALRNFLFVALLVGGVLAAFWLFMLVYARVLRALLLFKGAFLTLPVLLVLAGLVVWLGFDAVMPLGGPVALALIVTAVGYDVYQLLRGMNVPTASAAALVAVPVGVGLIATAGLGVLTHRHFDQVRVSAPWVWASHEFPGLGREFMPAFDEGAFLWMPTISYHGSIGEAMDVLQYQDLAISSVPEVDGVFGKIGRADSALDPAPVGMIESVIHYKSEYVQDDAGRRVNFRYDTERGQFVRDADGELIPDPSGRPYRQWRDHIASPDDIWNEIVAAAQLPGVTSAPKLQPIETRLVMLQTGMRAPMGIKVRAPDLDTLDRIAVEIEQLVREVPAVEPDTVNADRVVGKPYLEIVPDRQAIDRFGLRTEDVNRVIQTAVGGMQATTTVEGRERYPVRVRYPRELRQDIEAFERIAVPASDGAQVPLSQFAEVRYRRGPQMIRSEDTFLTAYVTFAPRRTAAGDEPGSDMDAGHAGLDHGASAGAAGGMGEVEVVEQVRDYLDEKVAAGELAVPAGVSWEFAGDYEHQVRAAQTLAVVVPVALAIIFLILYFQFRSVLTTAIVFSSIAVAWAGGFVMIHLYGQSWFANFEVFGVNMRELFNLAPINLSVAVWVGFLALFGIAVDNGVIIATYLNQSFARRRPTTLDEIREATIAAGVRRVRPCLMTTATTILALLPVLTATGTGADIMIPMAIPSVGGMLFVLLTMFSVPVLYCLVQEAKWRLGAHGGGDDTA